MAKTRLGHLPTDGIFQYLGGNSGGTGNSSVFGMCVFHGIKIDKDIHIFIYQNMINKIPHGKIDPYMSSTFLINDGLMLISFYDY